MDEQRRFSDRIVIGATAIGLVLGIGIYNVIPISSSSDEPGAAAARGVEAPASTGETDAAAAPGGGSSLSSSQPGSSFGSGVAALESGVTADDLGLSGAGGADDVTSTPTVPPAPCPTETASDLYDSVAGPLGDATGQQLPQDNLRVLTEIAAGCRTDSATTPLIGLALDLGRMVPDTGLAPVDLSAIPAVEAPALPGSVIDALAPLTPQIQEACGNIGLLGVLLAVIPGAASVPVHGQDLADAIVPAQTLCAQFEG